MWVYGFMANILNQPQNVYLYWNKNEFEIMKYKKILLPFLYLFVLYVIKLSVINLTFKSKYTTFLMKMNYFLNDM